MASSHIGAYKNSNRIDPKIKRRLRRSEEWQNKRDEEVNKRRNLGLMSPCRELDVDLSMDSSTLEAPEVTPHSTPNVEQNKKTTKIKDLTPKLRQNKKDQGKVETKSQQKNVKSSQASLERLKMLQKWKEEKEFKKKQEALERAKHKPFVVSVNRTDKKTNFERKWENEKQKKTTKQPEAPKTRTRTVTAPVRSTVSTNSSSQRTTRQTAAAAKQAAAPPTQATTTKAAPATRATRATVSGPKPVTSTKGSTRSALTKSQPASKTAPATRATRSTVSSTKPATSTRAAAAKKAPPKTTRTEPVRSSTRVSAKSDAKSLSDIPPTKIRRTTRGQKQKMDVVEEIESELETSLQEDAIVEPENESTFSKKTVSFAPEKFVFTAPEDLQSIYPSLFDPTALSPASTHSFFSALSDSIPIDTFRSSNSPQLKNVVTTRGSAVFKDKPVTCANDFEPCKTVQEDEKDSNVDECSSFKSSGTKSDSPSLDKNVEVPNETPERNVVTEDDRPIVEKNISLSKENELAAQNEELCEKKTLIATTPNRVAPSPLFKTPVSQGPKTRRMRRSLSETRFVDREKTASESRRRRKTEMSRTPQTPEEWVELLKNSPMIEMSRRKISKGKLSIAPLNLEISEEDLIAANIIPSKDSSNEVGEMQTANAEDKTEMLTAITESTTESSPEIASVEKDLVEPSIDSQPIAHAEDKIAEMLTANAEDKIAEMPTANAEDKTVEMPTANGEDKTVEMPTANGEDKTVEMPTANAEDKTVEMPTANAEDKTVEMPTANGEDKIAEMLTANGEDKTIEMPTANGEDKTVEMPTAIGEDKTVEMPTAIGEDKTVEMPTANGEDKTVEMLTANAEDKTAEMPTANAENKTAEMPTANAEDKTTEKLTEIPPTNLKHDVAYFRNLVQSQTDTLNSLAQEFEGLIPEVNGEVEGQIRTVIGQTKLLISKRFRQFIGLIDNCEYNTGEKETTCDDLQGFWDMVDFQVEDVRIKFEDLKKLKENGWQPLEKNPPIKKPIKKLVKKSKPVVSAKVSKPKGRSEFALFMAQKKKEAQEKKQKVASPQKNKVEEETSVKVFDGLFFKVESPVKSPKPHCEEILGSPLAMPTFVETDRTVRLSPTITTISIVENGDKSKVDSPKIAVCPEKEAPKMEPKSPSLSANASSSPVTSPLLSTRSLRRSFAPAVPSPLLQDITPNNRGRRSRKSFVFTDTGSPKTTTVQVPELNPKAETDREPAEKILVLQTPPLRRSGRVRRSLCSYSPNVKKTPSQDVVMQSFIKNLLSSESSSEGSETPKDEQISAQSPDPAPVFTPLTDGNDNENSTLKQKSRRRRTADPKVTTVTPKRRHSTRISRKSINSFEAQTPNDIKENVATEIDLPPPSADGKLKRAKRKTRNVAFSDKVSTLSIADSPSTVLCPVSPNVDTTEGEQTELLRKSGRFQTLKVGFTPVRGSTQKQFSTPKN